MISITYQRDRKSECCFKKDAEIHIKLIIVTSQRILNRYQETPFILAYALKPQSVTKTSPNLKLPIENRVFTTQNHPLDLSTSSDKRIISVLPAMNQSESMKYPSETKVDMTNIQLK